MNKVVITPYDVIVKTDLPEISVDQIPTNGDPLEIGGELYFVCEQNYKQETGSVVIGVIPLIVKNPSKVTQIGKYIECLSVAHRKVQFKNATGLCDLNSCDEMIIS